MSDPLVEPRLRCDRAREHLRQLEASISEYLESERGKIFASLDDKSNVAKLGFMESPEGPPTILSILVGEIVYNLRAALDYLVFLLAMVNSGAVQDGTQFPIYDSEQDFQGNVPRRLRGISQDNVRRLEDLQPYRSIEWTRTLRDLSNPDKHRHLTMLTGEGEHVLRVKKHEGGYDTEFEPQLEVSFGSGHPVLATLHELHSHVLETVASFEDVFRNDGTSNGTAS